MTRGLPIALCRLLTLLACMLCGQLVAHAQSVSQSAPQSTSASQLERGTTPTAGIAFHAGRGAAWVSDPGFSAEREPEGVPGNEPTREERESDDDPDQDDDFDDAQLLPLRGTVWGPQPTPSSFGAALVHAPLGANHRLLDPRPPRRR